MKTILLTGAAGFIGSHTSAALLSRGDRVIGIDNFNDYYSPERKRANVKEVRAGHEDRFIVIEGDIRDRAKMAEVFATYEPSVVINLAAMAGVRASMDDPHLYIDVNLNGTVNLLDLGRQHDIKNFVLASTSSVYGRTERIPFEEQDICDGPLAPYPASKRSAEMFGYCYNHLYGLNFTALRFFTVYGPRGRPDMMAYRVLDNIFRGAEVPLYNNGQMHRDWTYVEDIAQGIIAAADRPLGFEKINLGRGEPVLLADFVKKIEELAGKKASLVSTPMMAADIRYTYANIDKAKRLLDYKPKTSVDEGVERFWNWYRQAVLGSEKS